MLKKWLFCIAKGPLMGRVIGLCFQYCVKLIPVDRICTSRDVIAFRHPQPCYDNHLILSPRRPIRSLLHMADTPLCSCLASIWQTALAIRAAYPEYRSAFTLVANGGKRQEVQQVHFHMFTGHAFVRDLPACMPAPARRIGGLLLQPHPEPDWELHYVLQPAPDGDASAYFADVLQCIVTLEEEHSLVQRGYSLVCKYNTADALSARPVFHIVSGKPLR